MGKIVKKFALFIIFSFFSLFSCIPEMPKLGYTIKVTPEKIETQLRKSFPITRETDSFVVRLEEPMVNIENGKIYTGITVKVKMPPFLSISGSAYISGNVKYEPATGKIYLVEPSIEELSINGKMVISNKMPALKNIIKDVIQSTFRKIPIYRVNLRYRKQVKSIEISGNALLIKIGL